MEDKTLGRSNKGGIADLILLRSLLAICESCESQASRKRYYYFLYKQI